MSLVRKLIDKLRARRAAAPPVIQTAWGPVTEKARLQAALNMRDDPVLRDKVLAIVIKECGGDTFKGLLEFKRRYPEVYQ